MTTAMNHQTPEVASVAPLPEVLPREVPIEPNTSAGPAILNEALQAENHVEHKSPLVFKFLKKERPLPGKFLVGCMLGALFFVMFLAGWTDASIGPLLPSLQAYYNINYLIISIVWVFNFVGFMTAGITNVLITDRFGFGIAAPLGASMQALGYVLICWGPPYPLFVFSYVLNGFGLGIQDAQVNALTSRLPNASTKMFLMHAVYGFGATVSPLIATEFTKNVPNRVYLYFCASLGLALCCVAALVLVFRGRTEDQVVGKRAVEFESVPTESAGGEEDKERDVEVEQRMKKPQGSGGKMKSIMKTPAVHYMAFYIATYVGIEVTIGGWATSFLLDERGGNDNAGYVSVGYFGGITLGRVLLIPVTKFLGNHNSIYIYTILAIALELVIWFTRTIPGNAVCFALVGFLLGPMYPIVMMVVVETIPGELQAGSIGWIASLGQAGSAIMPFITGAIANHYGVWILQPLVIAFLGFSLVLWLLVPRPKGLRA